MRFRYPFLPATFEIPDDWIAAAQISFPLAGTSYRVSSATLVSIEEVEPPFRNRSTHLAFEGFDRDRLVRLLGGMRDGVELPPVRLTRLNTEEFPQSLFHFRVAEGFHRYHASVAAGFSELPAVFGTPEAKVTLEQAELAREMSWDAAAYFKTARKIANNETNFVMIANYHKPVNFLLAHCCELVLKALLVGRGFAIERMTTDLGHDLDLAADEAAVWGISLDKEFVRYCRIMGSAHRDYVFRYAERGTSPWVEPSQALEMIRPQLERLVGANWLR